ncbi:MAG: PAS domain-containing protein [Firmicutes bacterium]|nr:PAS domain-containing protein [Bacillota bacterium]
MSDGAWVKGFPAEVTVCDTRGRILEMNDRSIQQFVKYGGKELLGKNLLDCHPEPARGMLREMLEGERSSCYTTEKDGVKKLVYQGPWYQEGRYMGLVEISLEIPFEMPHFVR